MRIIAISDIHGCYNELKNLLSDLKYDKDNDKIIFLGDYIDRGKNSRLVIEFVRNLQKENKNVIALMGNHEDMLLNYYKGIDSSWLYNGSEETLMSYMGFNEQFKNDVEWMKNLPLYYEDEHFIYVHAGIDVNKPMEEQDKNTLLWIRDDFIYNNEEYHKRVIFGHTPTIGINGVDSPICTYANNIDIDTGCVYGGSLSALIIENGKIKSFYKVDKEAENKKEISI